MATEFALLKEEYIALRAEICQSIDKQHQITLAGYTITVAIFGYIVGMEEPVLETLAVIPIVLLAMTSLWTVECNRMVRAGYYIGYILWPALNKLVNATHNVGWETWIRMKEGGASDFRKNQHCLQLFVIVIVPIVVSVIALTLASSFLLRRFSLGIVVLWLVIIRLWIFIVRRFSKVSDLAAIIPNSGHKNSATPPIEK